MQRFTEKAPLESVVLTFNLAPGLAAGETLSGTPTVTVANIWGSDATCVGLVLGTPALDVSSTLVLAQVSGGVDQNDYAITATCATSNPEKTLSWSGILPVRLYPAIQRTTY